MGVEAVLLSLGIDVAVRQDFELGLAAAASGIDGKQDRPSDAKTDEADGANDSKVADEEIGVEALVLESVGIGDLPKRADPAKEAVSKLGTPFTAMALEGPLTDQSQNRERRTFLGWNQGRFGARRNEIESVE